MRDQAISQTAIEFSRHIKLESAWKDESRIPKDELRNFYTNEYKPEFKRANPGCNIVNFAGLFWVNIFFDQILDKLVFGTIKYLVTGISVDKVHGTSYPTLLVYAYNVRFDVEFIL